ncbi:SRPBCC domain-containing protein [Flagellimonas halotolerans]|uniref:SRPBCC domain-containing protein n=1 Tax=Flagellimonas halotolerans TaxID=3112164 RepID=A0ABU6IRE2_9FLAO|nr:MULTISPECIES: SRPBCC domain-containing protein [unclassified Allomuricauda]MEC3965839.1 SRPBCC domain-containing protein [Muricauda sp. SYSU M86414]MEC4265695.1 SRPBCC domain-containing protein [Muricauda sp. SYSU M84420]
MENINESSIKMTKTFNVPVHLFWRAITTPEYFKEWWGPDGFTNTIHKMDVREGGICSFTMHGPDGTDFENEYVYTKVVPLKTIVMEHQKEPRFTISITILANGDQTQVEWCNIFDSVPSKEEAIRAFKADEGLQQSLSRFNEYLKRNTVFLNR